MALAEAIGTLLDRPDQAAIMGPKAREQIIAKFAATKFEHSIAALAERFDRLTA